MSQLHVIDVIRGSAPETYTVVERTAVGPFWHALDLPLEEAADRATELACDAGVPMLWLGQPYLEEVRP